MKRITLERLVLSAAVYLAYLNQKAKQKERIAKAKKTTKWKNGMTDSDYIVGSFKTVEEALELAKRGIYDW